MTASAISTATPSWASVVLAPRWGVHTTSGLFTRGLSFGGGSTLNTSKAACRVIACISPNATASADEQLQHFCSQCHAGIAELAETLEPHTRHLEECLDGRRQAVKLLLTRVQAAVVSKGVKPEAVTGVQRLSNSIK